VEIFFCDTGSEHPDNVRFLKECEEWFGQKVNVLRSERFGDIYEVFEKRRFLVSPQGAPCTAELKKMPWLKEWRLGDVEVFGYTADEGNRLARFRRDNDERIIECPLIANHVTKDDCLAAIASAGIELPVMYRLGFRNNNCIGCVKARDSVDYWKRVRKHFPEQFARTAALERELNFCLNRVSKGGQKVKVFLDEIEPGDPVGRDPNIQCGLFCTSELDS
jgi:3'-phosphoadenosine 5'-phosphosulfate sulfotransferase (PAPS reductase)/FAD synthetase